ncbi:PREDICTED: uncharacterized protein LOC108558013 [Nicrophorus vespilloides]|uniref:Uncharacterized protein LOC108558013 n=1 Tax=Nicrophorus vespilloides TaxID=110193 RepID=A0ABM1M6T5_NICVS|nr:PREDICTED: uncharacterized protein LOC108558013 [Nicrophorus vespilloides]
MALRLASKINRNILTTFSKRTASSQRCVSGVAPDKKDDQQQQQKQAAVLPHSNRLVELIAQPYKVCRPRTTPIRTNHYHQKMQPIPFPRYAEEISARTARSRTVAQRMSMMNLSLQSGNLLEERVPSSDAAVRNYSTCGNKKKSEKKCKAVEQKTTCQKLPLQNCMQAKKTICRGREYIHKPCEKKQAPYPCFSETCVEEPYNKPSECKLCPWKPEDHPNFKPTKKNYHTNSERPSKSPGKLEDVAEVDEVYEAMNEVVQEKEAERSFEWLDNLRSDAGIPSMHLAGKKPKTRKCTKFPFKKETYEIGKKQVKPAPVDKCAKKKRKLIVDCPDEKEDKCATSLERAAAGMQCEGCRDGGDERDKHCPPIDNSLCDDKPQKCVKIKKKPKICPTDLIKKPGYSPNEQNKKNKKKKKKNVPVKKASNAPSFVTAVEYPAMPQPPRIHY